MLSVFLGWALLAAPALARTPSDTGVNCPSSAEANIAKGFTDVMDPPYILPYNVTDTFKMCGAMSIRSYQSDTSDAADGCKYCCQKSLIRANVYRPEGVEAKTTEQLKADIAACTSSCGGCFQAVEFRRGFGRSIQRVCLTDTCNTARTGSCFNVDQWSGSNATLGGWDSGYNGCNKFTDASRQVKAPDVSPVPSPSVAPPPPARPAAVPVAPSGGPGRPGGRPPATAPVAAGTCCNPPLTSRGRAQGRCVATGRCTVAPFTNMGGSCVLGDASACPAEAL